MAASSSAGRALTLCKQFQNVLRISTAVNAQHCAANVTRYQNHVYRYVLLKEKNMLLTLEQEARRQRVQMPSPERLRKVERSIIRLETVVTERETALRLLQTGQEKARPGDWRRNIFGHVFWYRFKEYACPWYMNKRYKRKRFYTPNFVQPHLRLRIEKYLRERAKKANLEKKTQAKLREKFPQMKISSS
ncbi:hypothetical protein F2P81_005624 [Scophthalmus maximus]|uniref:Large ribosomal subunit protein uL29m n=1 Tax=Scophthalmus maximus TaxID=52904 RepID=A0A6A4TJ56_SCOMX|nr:hypothetical protein F2P81_005624 [Scophthalmus maximus]